MTQADAAVAEATDDDVEEKKYHLSLEVDIQAVGPCRKHVRVKVPRNDISHFEGLATDEVVKTADVPGFRRGKVPAKLARRRFVDQIADSVRQRVLMLSLEQLADV